MSQPPIQHLSQGFVVINDTTFINIDYLEVYRREHFGEGKSWMDKQGEDAIDGLIADVAAQIPKLEAF